MQTNLLRGYINLLIYVEHSNQDKNSVIQKIPTVYPFSEMSRWAAVVGRKYGPRWAPAH
jgi:hypothetical protein